ncbi:anti-sigma factor [Tenacibaculum sp. AHE15PA]|uniref:anti-sigma factor n=1 Tax=Tenacibaculum TaxID=104267 RepID=UPI001C4F918B|nr:MULTISPECIES: anti-sigma factor [Tenacibaculum]QXP74601.1 anti-sigma factor [Tenacibaculum sp. AHE14PA]QXP76112.1 anti-sigma factor [Tenacibaculum sp. AHE15PA]
MEAKKHIESGILELYIAGALSEKENEQVYKLIMEHPEILKEVREIEKSISSLTAHVAPKETKNSFKDILIKMLQEKERTTKVIPLNTSKNNWLTYAGWAATLIIGSTLLLSINKNNNLQAELDTINQAKDQFEIQLEKSNTYLAQNESLLKVIRDKDIVTVPLQGQKVLPEAYAKVYWNKNTKNIYLDVQGLPDPPKGKVYQVWSLKLDPLSPTSLGTIDNFTASKNKVFTISNPNESQAFGITLEPAGGSISPNLEQLYTLGAV